MSADADKPPSPPVVPEYERRPIPFKGKASKEFVRRMIATGRYTINALDGTPITDWKRLFADIHEPSAADALDGDKSIPVADIVQPSPPVIQVPRAGQVPVQSPAVIVGSKKYTNRQLEHFGDAIVALTGRVMVHELCSTDQRLYFDFSGQLIRNKNLGHGDVRRGSAAEVEIGLCYVEAGFDAASECARKIIEQTEAWQNLVKLMESKTKSLDKNSSMNEVKETEFFCLDGKWFQWRDMGQDQKIKIRQRKVATAQATRNEADEKWWSNVRIL
jgi:hypothetical protein